MTEAHPPRIAIIGGGLSGLATAVQLTLSDLTLDLTVFESDSKLGGVIQTECADGFLIDHGADMFAINPPAALELCERLGVADQLIEPNLEGRGAYLVYRGKLVPIPDGFVLMRATKLWPMLTTPLLSPIAKLRLLTEQFRAANVDANDQSVADFVRARMGSEILDRIVGPLVAGIYTADIEKLSLLATMGPIAEMVRQHGSLTKATLARRKSGQDSVERGSSGARYNQFRAFTGGMTQLIAALAAAMPAAKIETNAPVSEIVRCQNSTADGRPQWRIVHPGGDSRAFDHVIVATPARVAAPLISLHAPLAARQLAAIESTSTAIVCLGVRRSDIKRPVTTFGFVVPAKENRQILAGSFASTKFAGRAPDDHVLIRVFIGGAKQPHLLANDDDELVAIARQELTELIGLTGEPIVQRVVRWNNAMPQYHVGHLDRVRQIDQAINDVPGLSLISNALHGVGIAPLIGNAKQTADQVIAELRRTGAAAVR